MYREEYWSVARGATIGAMLLAIVWRVLSPIAAVCYTGRQFVVESVFIAFALLTIAAQAIVRGRKRLTRTTVEQLHDAWLHGFDFVFVIAFVFLIARPVAQYLLTSVCR